MEHVHLPVGGRLREELIRFGLDCPGVGIHEGTTWRSCLNLSQHQTSER